MKTVVLYLCIVLGLVSQAGGAESATTADAQVLERLQTLSSGIETLYSSFTQEKYLAIFQESLSSKGRFYYQKPDGLRWELLEPVATGFVLKGGEGRRWHERTGQGERFDISREPIMKIVAEQLLAWARADFDWLGKNYRINVLEKAPVKLKLEPLSAAAAGFIDHLEIVFAADGRHVQVVEVHEKDGDFTRMRFADTVINRPLAKALFQGP